jgi:hypothetical protein
VPPCIAIVTENQLAFTGLFITAALSADGICWRLCQAEIHGRIYVGEMTGRTVTAVNSHTTTAPALEDEDTRGPNLCYPENLFACTDVQAVAVLSLDVHVVLGKETAQLWHIIATPEFGIAQGVPMLRNLQVFTCHNAPLLDQVGPG